MSVVTVNPFALLEAADASRPPSPSPPPARDAVRSSQQARTTRSGNHNSRGSNKRTSHKDTNPTTDGADEPIARESQRRYENRDNDNRANNSRGNDGRGRGRGARGGTRSRGRQYDKHSQTGKTDSEKKIHQSWGGDDGNTELKTEQQATADADLDGSNEWGNNQTPSADWGTMPESAPVEQNSSAEAEIADGGRVRKEREGEDNTLTFDQYRAQQKEQESVVPQLGGVRQANDGADASNWNDIAPLSKDKDSYFVGKSKSAPKLRIKKEEKVYLEIDGHFDKPERGGRGRGGRGGDRSRASRARGRFGGNRHSNTNNFDVADESAFPSLLSS